MRFTFILILIASSISGCTTESKVLIEELERPSTRIHSVSLINLIATPKKYHGKYVRLNGYAHIQFEDYVIYLSKDDATYLNGKNGLWLSFTSKHLELEPKNFSKKVSLEYFDNKFVLIEGVFDMNKRGHMGATSGSIVKISRLMEGTDWDKD